MLAEAINIRLVETITAENLVLKLVMVVSLSVGLAV